jgi:hypothetical protein
MRGQTVTLTLDRSGFVRAVEATGGAQEPVRGDLYAGVHKDRTITRLAVLKAAAEFAAARRGLKSGDVLKVAESWERWLLRAAGDQTDDVF